MQFKLALGFLLVVLVVSLVNLSLVLWPGLVDSYGLSAIVVVICLDIIMGVAASLVLSRYFTRNLRSWPPPRPP